MLAHHQKEKIDDFIEHFYFSQSASRMIFVAISSRGKNFAKLDENELSLVHLYPESHLLKELLQTVTVEEDNTYEISGC